MNGDYYGWVWQHGDTDCEPPEEKDWIKVFSHDSEEICVLVLRHGFDDLIPQREAMATQIVNALDSQMHALGG